MTGLEIAMAAIMVVGLAGLLCERISTRKGIGVRSIQFALVVLVIPSAVILAEENLMPGGAIATLFGAIVGYVLSQFGQEMTLSKNDKKKAKPSNDTGRSNPG